MKERLFYNGNIITMEDTLYTEAILIRDGLIVGIGSKEELRKLMKENGCETDLEGKTLMPSFIDAHSHFSGYANSLLQADLSEACSFQEVVELIENFIEKNNIPGGKWVVAKGFDQNNLEEQMPPDRKLLDKAAPHNPLVCQHQSGHSGVFNTLGLKELGITEDVLDPEGGRYGRENGSLTGFMEENAFVNQVKRVPMASMEEFFQALSKAQNRYASYGITTMQEGFVVKELSQVLLYLKDKQALQLDLIGYLDLNQKEELNSIFKDCFLNYHNHLKIGGYKIFLDGSPQSKTAWMLEPYQNSKECGYPIYQDDALEEKIRVAVHDNVQLLAHCNGDAACKQYIEMYEKVKEEASADIRPVMIHAQLLRREQLPKVKKLNMIPSFFAAHVYYWGDVHRKNFGEERASHISPAHSCEELGIPFTFHQDSPVIEPNMLETIWIAVNRLTKSGEVLGAGERVEPLEALKAVTIFAAYQYFEEEEKGSLRPGKRADLVILDKNPLTVDKMDIRDIRVLETIKDGETVYFEK